MSETDPQTEEIVTCMVLLLLVYLLAPAAVIWLCRKVSWLSKIGPILILYFLGIIVGNLPFLPENAPALQRVLSSAIIPLAIPMLLFNSDFRRFPLKKSALTLLCGLIAVLTTVVLGFLILKNQLGTDAYKIAGMLAGVYTGGAPNLAALKLMLDVPDETYILLNSYDILVSLFYLLFLMTVGIRFFRWMLPRTGLTAKREEPQDTAAENTDPPDPYTGILKKQYVVQILQAFFFSLVILAVSFGLAELAGERYFMAVIILSLTTLGIVASFIRSVRKLEKSYDAGLYLVYIFSVVVASMANLGNLDFQGGFYLLLYIIFVIFLSLAIQALLSKIFRIDADTVIISSVALINSPPMVPMLAAIMRNRDVIVTGLSIGVIGYAAGNYLGFLIAELLNLL